MIRQPVMDAWSFLRLPDEPLNEVQFSDSWIRDGKPVRLPHLFTKDGQVWRGLGVFSRRIPADPRWEKVFLEFDAVDQCCRVLIDGLDAGSHEGGYSRFRVPVPADAVRRGSFRVDVVADNRVNEHVSPHFGDFTVFGGIPRPVSLLICEENHFDYLYYGTDGLIVRTETDENGNGVLTAEPHTVHRSPATVALRVTDRQGKTAATAEGSADDPLRVPVPQALLWDGRAAQNLYTVDAVLKVNGRITDAVSLKTGFRRIEAGGEGFRLNGRKYFLRGVARHQDMAGVFTAASPEQIAGDFDLLDEIGANAVRLSHYQHPQAAYDACDERGILCWAEIPMLKMTEDEALMENARQQLTELILQNIHHPSVYCWGIQNEIAMFRDAPFMHEKCRELNSLAKRLDPGRLTACANLYPVPPESPLNGITDIVGYNYYFGWYYGEFQDYGTYLDAFHKARPETPAGITEYGSDANIALHSADPRVKDYSEEYQALYHESIYPFLRERDWLWGSYVWNMFDFSSERRNEGGVKGINGKGLVTYDRKTRKDAFYYYKAQWSNRPFLHICGRRYEKRAAEQMDVKIYTNCAEAVLTVNGREFGRGKQDGNGTIVFRNVPLAEGINHLAAASGGLEDRADFERVAEEPAGYRLPDSGGGNVLNWFLQGEQRADRFSILCTAQQVMESPAASRIIEEELPGLYGILKAGTQIPMGLTLKSILSRDVKDPEQIQRINKALQEIPLNEQTDRRE